MLPLTTLRNNVGTEAADTHWASPPFSNGNIWSFELKIKKINKQNGKQVMVSKGQFFLESVPKNYSTGLEGAACCSKREKKKVRRGTGLKAFWNNYPHLTMKLNCARTGCFWTHPHQNLLQWMLNDSGTMGNPECCEHRTMDPLLSLVKVKPQRWA